MKRSHGGTAATATATVMRLMTDQMMTNSDGEDLTGTK